MKSHQKAPKTWTLNPKPETLNPKPQTLNPQEPKLQTQNPKPLQEAPQTRSSCSEAAKVTGSTGVSAPQLDGAHLFKRKL